MAANLPEIFLLILGITGISNAFYPNEDFHGNRELYPHLHEHFEKNMRFEFEELCKRRYFRCNPFDFQIQRPHRNKYPKMPNPYFRYNKPFVLNNWNKYRNADSLDASSENAITSMQHDRINEAIFGQKLFNYIPTTTSDKSANSLQSSVYLNSRILSTSSPAATKFSPNLNVTEQNIPAFKISSNSTKVPEETETISNSEASHTIYVASLESEYKSSTEKDSLGLVESRNTFSTQMLKNSRKDDTMVLFSKNKEIENPSEFVTGIFPKGEQVESERTNRSKDASVISYSTAPEKKGTTRYIFSSTKTSSSQEILSTNEKNLEKESTVFQDSSSVITKTALDDKSNSLIGIQSTNNQNTELVSTMSQTPSFSTTDEETSLKIQSSSLEGTLSTNAQNFETESITSQDSTTLTSSATDLELKLSSFEGIHTTAAKTLENESTTKNAISASKIPLIPGTDKVTQVSIKRISSTRFSSSNTEATPEAVMQDHIIEISSIRTARIVITSVFLVIALIAITVLAVYMFRIKRKNFHYDQLLLIP